MVMNSRQRAVLTALCPSTRWEVSMASHSTFRAGGVVEAMAEPADSGQLAAVVRWLHREGVAWRAIGGGSNILVASRYHEGVFIRLRGSVRDLCPEPASPHDPDRTRVTVEAIRGIVAVIEEIHGISAEISSAVEQQAATSAEISRNVAEAAAGSSEIAVSIGGIAAAAQTTTDSIHRAGEAADRLASMGGELRELVSRFRY